MLLMQFRAILAATVAFSLNMSLCTGGIFSSFTAFAAEFEPPILADSFTESMPMSFAALEYMSCAATSDDPDVLSHNIPQGCKDKQTCLSQSHHTTVDRLARLLSLDLILSLPPSYKPKLVATYEVALSATARAGPLFEESIGYTRSLQKRE